MASNIKFKRSAVQNRVPTTAQLELGELALNTYDGKLYTEKNSGSAAVVEIGSILSSLVVDGANGGGGGDVVFHGTTAGRDLTWDYSNNALIFADNALAYFGSDNDLNMYHTGSTGYIKNTTGTLYIQDDSSVIIGKVTGSHTGMKFIGGGALELYHNNNLRLTTTADGADIGGTGSLKLPVGTTAQRSGSPTAGDMRYNSTTGSFEGYTNGWGELGGAGIGIGSTSVNPGSGVVGDLVGVGYTTINFVGAGLSVTGYGTTIVVDIGNAVSRKYGRKIHSYTATANQTTFTGLSYTDGASQVSVYLNGAKLSAAAYTATSGNTVVLGTGASVDDEVEILVLDSGVDITRTVHSFTATAGQTAFTGLGYERGENLDVYLNGIRLAQSDYTANNGTSLTLATGASVGDLLEVVDMGPGAQWESGFGEDNDDIFRFNGGVGIGTTNPTDKLNIVGNVNIAGVTTAIGNFAIGNVVPARNLHVKSTTPYIRVESGAANQPATLELFHTRGNGSDKWPVSVATDDAALTLNVASAANGAPAEKVRIASDGKVGLGTNNPAYPLDIWNASTQVRIQDSDPYTQNAHTLFNQSGGLLTMINRNGSGYGTFVINQQNNSGQVERFRITNTGRVGIAQASPDYELDVTGSIGFTAQMRGASGSQGAPAYSFDGDSDTGMWRGGVNTLSFATGGTQRVVITDATTTVANNLTVTGNLQIDGTTTTVNSATMTVDDKNIVLGSGAANDAAADGGGITLESGNGNKTFNWVDATDAWTSSEHIHFPDNKKIYLGGASGTYDGFELYHDGSNSFIKDMGTGQLFIDGGAVNLRYGGNTKLATTSSGVSITGSLTTQHLTVSTGDFTSTRTDQDFSFVQSVASDNNSRGFIFQKAGGGNIAGVFHVKSAQALRSASGYAVGATTVIDSSRLITATGLNLNDTNTALSEGSTNTLRITTDSGYVDIGPKNTSWCHFHTDRASFYFAQKASWNGNILPYSDSAHDLGTNGTRWANVFADTLHGDGANVTNVNATTLDSIDSGSFLRSDANDTCNGILSIAANKAIDFITGTWTGNTSGGTGKIQAHDSALYICGGDNGIRFREHGTDRWYIDGDGHFRPHSDSTYNVGSDSHRVATVYTDKVSTGNEDSRDKLRVWNSTTYAMGMGSAYTFGALNNDYAMTFQMNSDADRGFWWGDSGHNNAQGAMSLNTEGKLTVAHSLRLGYGESDTTIPGSSYKLDVSGDVNLGGNIVVGSGSASYITMVDSDNGNRQIHCNSDNIGFLTAAGAWAARCNDAGQWQCLLGLDVTGNVDIDGNTTYAAGHFIKRADNKSGSFQGLHGDGSNNDTHSCPIYTIGSNYNPALTTLGNMYGIGFSHGNASFTPSGASWGLYVAANGNSTIYLDAGQSKVYIGSSGNRNISQVTGDYGTFQCNATGVGSYQGWGIDGRVVFMHDGANVVGIYNDVDNEWLFRCDRNGASMMYHNNTARVTTDGSGAVIDGRIYCTGTSTINNLSFTLNSSHTQQGRFTTSTSNQNASNAAALAGTPGTLSYAYGYQEASSTSGGTWANPFPNMVFGYHTGIQIGGHYNYGGTRFYNDHPSRTSTKLFSVGEGDNNTRCYYNMLPNANNANDLGSSSLRWKVIYTNDLELSNKGSQNNVDGTWGDWTLQEGEDNIYMINNRSGKKFKINMTEVS